jgi:hypothetical protein
VKTFWLSALGALALAAGLAVPAASPSAGAIVATLTAVSPTKVPQGEPFRFRAAFSGPTTSPLEIELRLQEAPVGAPTETFFARSNELPRDAAGWEVRVTPSQWFRALGAYQVVALVNGVQAAAPLLFTVTAPVVRPAVFQDVTAKLGLVASIPAGACTEEMMAGAAWADVDGDGRLDLYLPRSDQPAKLFMNRGKRGFVDEAAARGVAGDGTRAYGAVFADYDNDGRPDLHVTAEGKHVLYRNTGAGRFVDATASMGLAGSLSNRSSSWGDYDNDGRIDLYVTTYGVCDGPAHPDQLFHNDGGRFTDVSSLVQPNYSSTPDLGNGRGFQTAWFDYNADGRQDLYVANDFFLSKPDFNRLWRNDGRGPDGRWRFSDVSKQSGAGIAINSMGIGVSDYNRDGRLDLAVSDIGGNALLRNKGDGTFASVAAATGVEAPLQSAWVAAVTWGTMFGDFNLDGWEDLYIAAGYIRQDPWDTYPQPNQLFVNDRGRRFLDLRSVSRADDPDNSRGVATADYDRDGRLDLLVVDQPGTLHLYRNVTPRSGSHWLEVDTVGRRSNRDGCGARLVLSGLPGGTMVREVFCGSVGHSSGSDSVVHFGLGRAKVVPRLTVLWPSGKKQILRKVKADRLLKMHEPK